MLAEAEHRNASRSRWEEETYPEADRAHEPETSAAPDGQERKIEGTELESNLVKGGADRLGATAVTAVARIAVQPRRSAADR